MKREGEKIGREGREEGKREEGGEKQKHTLLALRNNVNTYSGGFVAGSLVESLFSYSNLGHVYKNK